MMNPQFPSPRDARLLRQFEDFPTRGQREYARAQNQAHRAQEWARQRRRLLLAENIALRLTLRAKPHGVPWYNRLVGALLHSPLHWLISHSTLLLALRGRTSHQRITLPVNYVTAHGGDLYAISPRTRKWWRNLVGGAPIAARVRGQERTGVGTAIVDSKQVAHDLRALVFLVPRFGGLLNVKWDANDEPDADAIQRAAQKFVLVRLHLD